MHSGFLHSFQPRLPSSRARHEGVGTFRCQKTELKHTVKFGRRSRLITNCERTVVAQLSEGGARDDKSLKRLAVLVSGGGRSVENICERIQNGQLCGCRVCVVVCSKQNAGALDRVSRFEIPTRVVRLADYSKNVEKFSSAVSDILDAFDVHFVIMAGWMHFYRIPDRYLGRVINIHPSLIPAFCGKGFYGARVHEAVVRSNHFTDTTKPC